MFHHDDSTGAKATAAPAGAGRTGGARQLPRDSAPKTDGRPAHAAEAQRPTIRLHLWIESQDGVFFGIGRAQLLFRIREHGSLRQAAKSLGMSYRAAWGKLQRTEQALGFKLVESRGQRRDGVRLTPEGEELADSFQAWFETVERCAATSAKELLPFDVSSFNAQPK